MPKLSKEEKAKQAAKTKEALKARALQSQQKFNQAVADAAAEAASKAKAPYVDTKKDFRKQRAKKSLAHKAKSMDKEMKRNALKKQHDDIQEQINKEQSKTVEASLETAIEEIKNEIKITNPTDNQMNVLRDALAKYETRLANIRRSRANQIEHDRLQKQIQENILNEQTKDEEASLKSSISEIKNEISKTSPNDPNMIPLRDSLAKFETRLAKLYEDREAIRKANRRANWVSGVDGKPKQNAPVTPNLKESLSKVNEIKDLKNAIKRLDIEIMNTDRNDPYFETLVKSRKEFEKRLVGLHEGRVSFITSGPTGVPTIASMLDASNGATHAPIGINTERSRENKRNVNLASTAASSIPTPPPVGHFDLVRSGFKDRKAELYENEMDRRSKAVANSFEQIHSEGKKGLAPSWNESKENLKVRHASGDDSDFYLIDRSSAKNAYQKGYIKGLERDNRLVPSEVDTYFRAANVLGLENLKKMNRPQKPVRASMATFDKLGPFSIRLSHY